MTSEQVQEFVREMERRFVERTPTTDANYINADWRVGRSEMVTWARDVLGVQLDLSDTTEPELNKAVKQFWKRMRQTYPQEFK